MGLSGYKGTATFQEDEVVELIKWDATPSAFKKEYGHNKSSGWQDITFGIKRIEGTMEVKCDGDGGVVQFGPATIAKLVLYPFGDANGQALEGLAGIESVPISVNIENGEPVSATYKWASKGKWTGLPNDDEEWGGFEGGSQSAGSV